VAKVRELGPLLLDLKNAAEVQALAPPAKPKPVPVVTTSSRQPEPVLASDSREEHFWWETLNDPQVRQALGNLNERDMRELTAIFCQLGDATRSDLLAPLGLSLYQAAVLLGVSFRTLGRAAFTQIFGKPGNPATVTAFTAKLKLKGIGSRSDVRSLARQVEGVLATMPRSKAAPQVLAAQ
jgi:hypothetical protein